MPKHPALLVLTLGGMLLAAGQSWTDPLPNTSGTTASSSDSKTPTVKITKIQSVSWGAASNQPSSASATSSSQSSIGSSSSGYATAPPKPIPSQPKVRRATATAPSTEHRAARQATPHSSETALAPSTPQGIIAVEAKVSAINLTSTPPTLQISMANGKVWTLTVDPKTTVVRGGAQRGQLDDLRIGQTVVVSYALGNEQRLVQSVDIKGTVAPTQPTPSDSPATPGGGASATPDERHTL